MAGGPRGAGADSDFRGSVVSALKTKEKTLKQLTLVLLAAVPFVGSCSSAHRPVDQKGSTSKVSSEEVSKAPLMVSPADLRWTEVPERKGMQYALLSGDPKEGAYTQLRKVPAGTSNPLHTHSSELKNVIISGVWYTGADAATARDFGAGSIIIMPANWVHVSGCRAGSDCLFYQQGKGKFDFNPVSPGASEPKP